MGFDVELAYRLAAELGVRLEFIPMQRERLDEDLDRGVCDLVMSGIAITTDRASRTTMSSAYLDETLALDVPDAAREQFATWDDIRALGGNETFERHRLVALYQAAAYHLSRGWGADFFACDRATHFPLA